jgi:hypothetical protein
VSVTLKKVPSLWSGSTADRLIEPFGFGCRVGLLVVEGTIDEDIAIIDEMDQSRARVLRSAIKVVNFAAEPKRERRTQAVAEKGA